MKIPKTPRFGWIAGSLAIGLALALTAPTARAYVFASDIYVGGSLTGTSSVGVGGSVSVTYHLNDAATAGVKISFVDSNGHVIGTPTTIASGNPGALMGLNSVTLTAPATAGSYSVSVSASATGYSTWNQFSPLDANHTAVFPKGIAVDRNTNSPYYGRVVLGCATSATTTTTATTYATARSVTQLDGFYKFNADGTPADEGSYGYAGYTKNDAGNFSSQNSAIIGGNTNMMANLSMPSHSTLLNPFTIRIGNDDSIYWADVSANGSVQACDITASTYHTVWNQTTGYANCPDLGLIDQGGVGWIGFDIINTGAASTATGKAALFVADYGDYPSAGIWMWHLVGTPGNMVTDPNDTSGTQAVYAGVGSDVGLLSSSVAVDNNLDIYVDQDRNNAGDPANRAITYTNWNGGILPPSDDGSGTTAFNYAETTGSLWQEGSADNTDEGGRDIGVNSHSNPILVAMSHTAGTEGIRLLNALDASFNITNVVLSGGNLTLTCACSPYEPVTASQLTLMSSTDVSQPFTTPVTATFTGANGVFQTTIPAPSGTTYYIVPNVPHTGGTIPAGSAVTMLATGPVTTTLANIDSGHVYYCSSFDTVGNLYAATTTDNYWRAWSPPGPNTATTVAVAKVTTH